MLRLDYLKQNLLRNPIRTGLTAVAVSMPIVVYILSMAIVRNVESFLDQSVQQMRLVVVQKSSLINPLPAGYRRKIEALDPTGTRIVSVCRMRWFGGRVPGSQTQNYFMAADVDIQMSGFCSTSNVRFFGLGWRPVGNRLGVATVTSQA